MSATIARLPTGVTGLDDVLGGGLPEFSFNVITGPPGSGKTTLAHQMMFAMATPARPAIYFTVLGEPPLKMLRYQQQFDFFDSARVNRALRFVSLADVAASGNLEKLLARIVGDVEAQNPALVFVDSFRSVLLASPGAAPGLQHFIQQLAMLMTCWQATTFLVDESAIEAEINPIFTVADGVIRLRQSVQRNSVVRKLDVMKMRGQPALPGLHTFRIGAAGINVFATMSSPAAPAPGGRVAVDERVLMGVPGLDDLLGGGLPRGYSLLVAGPSGSGKSILASAFLAEGARQGEVGVIAAFEQHPSLSRSRGVADLIDAGRVGLVHSHAPDLSVDEVAAKLVTTIHRLGASRVVIDSLSGFELALAPSFRDDFRESMARMVTALVGTGATVLMTSELEDRYTDLRFSPYGTAFLTDAIIVQRYIEVDSRLERVLAVVKVRASAHSNELRRYRIDAAGIQIGTMLADHEGLLGGRPTRRPALGGAGAAANDAS